MGTKIDYVDESENFVTGCTKVSPGCKNCYSEIMTKRLKNMGQKKYQEGFDKVVEHWDMLPMQLKTKPTRYFINSMSDTFHPDVSFNFLYKLFEKFIFYPWNTFVIVTKRAERASEIMTDIWYQLSRNYPQLSVKFPLKNVWLIVTTENQETANKRIPYLLKTPVAVRGLSIEPMLGNMSIQWALDDCNGTKIDWVIVGGESGSKARPMHPDWPKSIRDQCKQFGTAFWFKQWGEWGMIVTPDSRKCIVVCKDGTTRTIEEMKANEIKPDVSLAPTVMSKLGKKKSGNILDGKTHSELPSE